MLFVLCHGSEKGAGARSYQNTTAPQPERRLVLLRFAAEQRRSDSLRR